MEAAFNYCEAGLWFVLGVIVVVATRKQSSLVRCSAQIVLAACLARHVRLTKPKS